MLKRIKLKNFRSFGNLEADFTMSAGKPKKLIMIYGENGSGKSNCIFSVAFLKNTLKTLLYQEHFNEMFENKELENYDESMIKSLIKLTRSNLAIEIKENKMIDSVENMVLEFDFLYSLNKEAVYKMEFDNDKIVHESFWCQLEKNMVKVYEISNDMHYFNNNLFLSETYKKEMYEKILKYFGRHTFLAIIFNEKKFNNYEYIEQNISSEFIKAIDELNDCSLWCKYSHADEGFINTNKIMKDLAQGSIPKKEEKMLLKVEDALNNYFVSLYSDIKGIHYEIEENKNKLKYNLYFDKLINGKIRSIAHNYESTGTLKLLDIFPYIYKCLNGGTVFIDEIDSGVHDLLMNYILINMENQINGQLVITTHNTMLLQKISSVYSYVINIDINGNKTLNCFKDFGRIQNNHNVATRYINGIFGGIPQPGHIDLQEIMTSLGDRS